MTALLEPLRLRRPGPPRGAGTVGGWPDWVAVAGMLVAWALLQAAFVRQPQPSDQLHYFLDAATLPAITDPPHQALRIGLTIPVWVLIQVFGYSEVAYYAVGYAATAGLLVATYWLGRLLATRAVGIVAGMLVVANPVVLDDASQLLPDIPATALLTGAVVVVVWRWRATGLDAPLGVADRRWLVAVGVALGWSYLVREFIVFWFPVVVLVLIVLRVPRAGWRLVAAGTAVMVALELVWGLVFHGNPLARVAAALDQPASPPWRVAERTELIAAGEIPDTALEILLAMPRSVLAWDAGWLLAGLLLTLVIVAILVDHPPLRLLLAWVAVPVALLLTAIEVAWLFDNRILRAEKLRYWLPALPPLLVGGVMALDIAGRRLRGGAGRRAAAGVAAVVLVAVTVLTGAQLDERGGYTRTGQAEYLVLREWLAGPGGTCGVVWADDDHWRAAMRWLPMYTRSFWGRPVWDGRLRSLNRGDAFVDRSALDAGALVRSRTSLERRNLEGGPVPAWLQEPPQSWPVLLETDRDRVRVLAVGGQRCALP